MGGKAGRLIEGAAKATAITVAVAFLIPGTVITAGFVASMFTLNLINGILNRPPSAPGSPGRLVTTRDPLASRKIVYGKTRIGGTITYLESTNDNKDLHQVISFAGHEISAVKELYFNELVVSADLSDGVRVAPDAGTAPDYSSKSFITAHFGSTTQAADTDLVSETSAGSSFRQRGVFYVYLKHTYDDDIFPGGAPNVTAVIEGKKVYDPRSDTTVYSNNPALCIRDYLTNTDYGLGATTDEIDDALISAAANVCDESINTYNEAGSEPRYTISGVIDTAADPSDNLAQMLTTCAGMLYYSNGKWKLKVGEYRTPSGTIDLDDLRGPIEVNTGVSGRERFNAVRGVFISPADSYQPADYPVVTSSTFEAEDGGERKYIDLALPLTASYTTAQRLAKQFLYRHREQITVTLQCKLTAFKYEVGDTIYLNNDRFGWNLKVFEVLSWSFVPDLESGSVGVDLVLRETSPAVYDWASVDEKAFTSNNSNLPNPYENPAPGIAIVDELRVQNEEAISVLIATVTGGGGFVTDYEVQVNKNGGNYINMGQSSANTFELVNVEDGAAYTVRARTVNSLGIKSPFSTASHNVIGKTAVPSDVTNLQGNIIGNQLLLTWDAVTDADLSYYRVRYAAADAGNSYKNAITLLKKVSRPATSVLVPARNGDYYVKAVDKLGLVSYNPATITIDSDLSNLESLNTVQTIDEHTGFTGTKSDVVYDSDTSSIILDSANLFDSATGDFDDGLGLFDGGGGNVDNEGYYYFNGSCDLGAVYLSRHTASLKSLRLDYVNLFDSGAGNFDERPGNFDGDADAHDDTDAEVQIRTTSDDPAGSPTWSGWQGFTVSDFKARAAQYRVKMTSQNNQASISIDYLSIDVSMLDRVERAGDIASGAATKSVSFASNFKATPSIAISAQNMTTGDYYEITNKARTGFDITFKNSGGTPVNRTFDYSAVGYGKEI